MICYDQNSGMEQDRTFLKGLFIGYKHNNYSYLQHLVDDYFLDRIDHLNDGNNWKISDWMQQNQHFQHVLNKIALETVQTEHDKNEEIQKIIEIKNVQQLMAAAVTSFMSRCNPMLQFRVLQKYIYLRFFYNI